MKKHLSYKLNNKNGWHVYVRGAKTSVTVEAAWMMHELGMSYTIRDKGELLTEFRTPNSVEDFLTGYLDQELKHGR